MLCTGDASTVNRIAAMAFITAMDVKSYTNNFLSNDALREYYKKNFAALYKILNHSRLPTVSTLTSLIFQNELIFQISMGTFIHRQTL